MPAWIPPQKSYWRLCHHPHFTLGHHVQPNISCLTLAKSKCNTRRHGPWTDPECPACGCRWTPYNFPSNLQLHKCVYLHLYIEVKTNCTSIVRLCGVSSHIISSDRKPLLQSPAAGEMLKKNKGPKFYIHIIFIYTTTQICFEAPKFLMENNNRKTTGERGTCIVAGAADRFRSCWLLIDLR